MRLVFLGPPGVGKGTQADKLSQQYSIPHIAMGDILRAAVSKKTCVGLEARSYIDSGRLVPDDVIINIICERLKEPDAQGGYILDGFPRTIKQAEALSKILDEDRKKIDRIIYFHVSEDELVRRIAGRRSCPSCQQIYHTISNPPRQDGICDRCRTPLVQRKDDDPETVKKRLIVYKNETTPLIDYYEKKGLLLKIEAGGTMDEVTRRLEIALDRKEVRDLS